jgi:hypothetical protein
MSSYLGIDLCRLTERSEEKEFLLCVFLLQARLDLSAQLLFGS